MGVFEALLLGVVEGLTEFLPISSTGHLILVSKLLGIAQTDVHKAFEVVIQLGSILAIVVLYFKRFMSDRALLTKLVIAFIPTGILGFLFYKHIKAFFVAETVAYMLIIGGFILIAIELWHKKYQTSTLSINDLSYKNAFMIGVFQSLSMIPGTSRSGATILGGLVRGLDRKSAAEFSFMLAVPTMVIATAYDLFKHASSMNFGDTLNLSIGFVTAFLVALVTVKGLLNFVSRYSFIPFGIYRIVLGSLFLWYVF